MNFVRKLFKPRWQSADAAVRLAAVSGDAAPELIAALPQIARGDAAAAVRLAALRRLANPGVAQALARDDADAGNREAARALWFDLLSGRHPQAPALAERLRLAAAQDAPRLIEHLAEHANETELRAAALARVTRPALLVERATAEPDAALRLALVERIDEEALLERIAERSRKRDKQVYRRARDKIDAARLARGDDGAIAEQARRICEQLEQRLREGDPGGDEDTALRARWDAIADRAPASFRIRFQAASDLLALRRDPEQMAALRHRNAEIEAIGTEIAAIEDALADAGAIHQRDAIGQRFDALAERWSAVDDAGGSLREAHEQRLSRIVARLGELANAPLPEVAPAAIETPVAAPRRRDDPAEAERRRAERERRQTALQDALVALEAALDAGQSGPAHQAHARLAAARQALHEAPGNAVAQRLADAEGRYAQIARWQRWSDEQRREALCSEIEALAASGLHPDAVATRVREAQAEWSRLDAHGGERGASGGLGRRFHAACREAIKPTRAYFEKRGALRQTQAQTITALLDAIAAPDDAAVDVRALATRRREVTDALRSLDRVDPRERKALAERLRGALAALDARIGEHDAAVEAAKQRLIDAAAALSNETELRSAIAGAKDLQRRWQSAGNGRRARDQQQWSAFRSAIDAVFARADGERAARDAQFQAARQSAAALCGELEALAGAERVDRTAQARIEQAWQALGLREEDLQRRFRSAQDALRDAAERRARAERRAGFDAWLATYATCRSAERGERDAAAVRAEVDAIGTRPVAAVALSGRLDRALAGTLPPADEEALRDCLVELEALAGVDSPDQDRQRRLDLQVSRLSARLRGDQADGSPEQTLTRLLERWTDLGAAADPALDARLDRAVRHLLAGWR